jgi:heme/copper-type cytochrome/quinol oxidase subunit 1
MAEWDYSKRTKFVYQTELGLGDLSFWTCFAGLLACTLAMHIIAVVVLRTRVKRFH